MRNHYCLSGHIRQQGHVRNSLAVNQNLDALFHNQPHAFVTNDDFGYARRRRLRQDDIACRIRTQYVSALLQPIEPNLVQVTRRCQQPFQPSGAPFVHVLVIRCRVCFRLRAPAGRNEREH